MKQKFRVALAGNPNCGKTTIFNYLTGAHQHVGNYSGVTVERKSGVCHIGSIEVEVIDLPGIYSLSSSSPEEKVAFNELLTQEIDLILNIIDAGNPQRNLYLTTQLAELGVPMLLVFNMADDAHRRGLKFNIPILERYFGAPIVRTVGARGRGIEHMKSQMAKLLLAEQPQYPARLRYGESLDNMIAEVEGMISKLDLSSLAGVPVRYFAIKLLEGDAYLCSLPVFAPVADEIAGLRTKLAVRFGVDCETILPDARYGMISGACREAIRITNERRQQLSDNIDRVMTNRYLGLPIFLLIMFAIFALTFLCAEPFVGLLENFFDWLADTITKLWPEGRLEFIRALIADGIIGGVGGVLGFLPNILFLFLGIAFLEGTGYMARAAYVMDGFMHIFGLHGKSFIPMLLGFGCTVPAVLATRSIESEKDRLTTIMVLPLMSCSARLPIYSLLIPAFFPQKFQALTMWIIYVLGIVLALIGARVMKSTLFKGSDEVYLMELPPYRMPTFKSLLIHMWERSLCYLRKAGTLILLASILLFVINTLPEKTHFSRNYAQEITALEESGTVPEAERKEKIMYLEGQRKMESLEYSVAGRIGRTLEVVMKPIGFDWRICSALIGAFAAKELFVSQLGILFSMTEVEEATPLQTVLKANYTPLQAFCMMVFCLVSMPCVGTVAVVRRETNSWKLTLLQLFGLTLSAYLLCLVIYQLGSLLRIGTSLL